MGVSVSVEAKIPFIGSSSVTVSAETSHNWQYGKENTETTVFTGSTPVKVPAGKVYKGIATAKSTQMNIPYEGTVHFKDTTVTKKIEGTY